VAQLRRSLAWFWWWSGSASGSRIGFSDSSPLLDREKMIVGRIAEKVTRGFGWNFQGKLDMAQPRGGQVLVANCATTCYTKQSLYQVFLYSPGCSTVLGWGLRSLTVLVVFTLYSKVRSLVSSLVLVFRHSTRIKLSVFPKGLLKPTDNIINCDARHFISKSKKWTKMSAWRWRVKCKTFWLI